MLCRAVQVWSQGEKSDMAIRLQCQGAPIDAVGIDAGQHERGACIVVWQPRGHRRKQAEDRKKRGDIDTNRISRSINQDRRKSNEMTRRWISPEYEYTLDGEYIEITYRSNGRTKLRCQDWPGDTAAEVIKRWLAKDPLAVEVAASGQGELDFDDLPF
jgi:hypothetical protein